MNRTTTLFTFKDGRPKDTNARAALAPRENASGVALSLHTALPYQNRKSDLTILDSKWSKTGALSQKWRIKTRQEPLSVVPALQQNLNSTLQMVKEQTRNCLEDLGTPRIPCGPTDTAQYRLARTLVATFEGPEAGYKLTAFGKYMRDIPKYVGESAALDAAATCLANAHFNMIRHCSPYRNQVADPVLYLMALQRLQEALADPTTGMSTYTLAATTLLGIVEVRKAF
ncbi:MAG: hypothetical protein M1822_007109 [Bathelium mastoideum]|nr:MAG: hypothetical protein M1822_007109 [Bathelium mastoideum]